jgi:HK97 family phage major capsid protein
MKTTTIYNRAFWNAMRDNQNAYAEMKEGTDHTGGYLVPTEFNENYLKALEKGNVFRRLATVVNITSKDGTIHAVASTGEAEWLNESVAIPESNDAFKQFPIASHKLASLSRIKESFVKDNDFNLEGYLENEFARRFGRSEESAFINGNSINEPAGYCLR